MGMSTHVVGIKPPDEKWRKMKAAADACDAAGVGWPAQVIAFFGDEIPDPSGVVVDLDRHPSCSAWSDADACASGIQVDIGKLPPDVKLVRFVNSW